MLIKVDRLFGWLLVLSSLAHTLGTFMWIPRTSDAFIWSLGSSLAAALLGVLNVIRAGRPRDRPIAFVTAIGTACWVFIALGFGKSIGNVLDPRALTHAVISVVLVLFSVRTLRRSGGGR